MFLPRKQITNKMQLKVEQLKQLLANTKSQRNIPETHDENGFQKTIK